MFTHNFFPSKISAHWDQYCFIRHVLAMYRLSQHFVKVKDRFWFYTKKSDFIYNMFKIMLANTTLNTLYTVLNKQHHYANVMSLFLLTEASSSLRQTMQRGEDTEVTKVWIMFNERWEEIQRKPHGLYSFILYNSDPSKDLNLLLCLQDETIIILFFYSIFSIMGIFFPCLLHSTAPLFDISIRSCHVGWPVSQQRSELKTQSCLTWNIVYQIILVQQQRNNTWINYLLCSVSQYWATYSAFTTSWIW